MWLDVIHTGFEPNLIRADAVVREKMLGSCHLRKPLSGLDLQRYKKFVVDGSKRLDKFFKMEYLYPEKFAR